MADNSIVKKARESAKKDIKKKERRLSQFERDLKKFFKQIADDYSAIYHASGEILNLNESYEAELNSVLKRNYRDIQADFSSDIRSELDAIAKQKELEAEKDRRHALDAKIAVVLGAVVLLKAKNISPKIIKTIQETLIKKTNDFVASKALEGITVGRAEVASTVGKSMKDWGSSHAPIVALTETQTTAEQAKYIEASGIVEEVLGKGVKKEGADKTWVTYGDEKVRSSHQSLDSRTINQDDLFVTGQGNSLLFAGDIDHAPISDVINCRCSTVYHLNSAITEVIMNKIFKKKGK